MTVERNEAERIQETMDRMVVGYDRSDADLIVGTYEIGAVYAAAADSHVTGSAALRLFFQSVVDARPVFEFKNHEIIQFGDLALHLARYDAEVRLPDDAVSVHSGVSVAVLRRQADGSWLIAIDHPAADRLVA